MSQFGCHIFVGKDGGMVNVVEWVSNMNMAQYINWYCIQNCKESVEQIDFELTKDAIQNGWWDL